MSLYTSLQDLSGARPAEANHAGDMIDYDLLRTAHTNMEVLPTAGETDRDIYHGAVVFDPVAGVHRNVSYPDYSSLYPHLIFDVNASPETIVGVGERTLVRSEYSRDELRWSYIDPRPVKRLSSGETYSDFTDGTYKMVHDPSQQQIKWRDDWSRIQEYLEPIYFRPPSERQGLLPSRVEEYIRWNKSYTGTMYDATKRVRNCFTPDTEVLTPEGVVNIRDLAVGDEVYSINPETKYVEVKPVTATHHYPDGGDPVIHFNNRSVDLKVTLNHRMIDGGEFVEASDIVWKVRSGEKYTFPKGMGTITESDISYTFAHNGVYCVTVADNHTMMAGRNGKFQWVGQSLYGVSGDSNFRLFDWRVAEAITIGGRLLLEYGADAIVERLQSSFSDDVVYVTHGDTDGLGIAVDQDVGRGHVLPRVRETVEWLNDTGMPQFVEDTFGVPAAETQHEVDLESYSPKLLIPEDTRGDGGTKKTYAERVTWDEGDECDELSITGFEAKRSDVADITAEVQSDVIEAICYNGPLRAREIAYERIRDAVQRVRDGDVLLAELGQRKGLSKDPSEYGSENRRALPTYRGAKYAKQHIDGENEFSKPMKFPVERIMGDLPSTYDAETAEDGDLVDYISVEDTSNIPAEIVIDREQIIDEAVRQPLRSILQTMDWGWDEAVHGHEQTALEGFA